MTNGTVCHPRESGDPSTNIFVDPDVRQDDKQKDLKVRKAQALKANLAKRKQQQRARVTMKPTQVSGSES